MTAKVGVSEMARKSEELLTSDLLRGNSITLVLSVLASAAAPGYVVTELIRLRSGKRIDFKDGSVYPLLHDLQNRGLVTSEWEIREGERPKRVYALTAAGKAELERRTAAWRDFARGVDLVLEGERGGDSS
ncbi:MAG TPA: PadR family transcriptional regulator [Fimbriimonadaceae bacterium]|nr:PadR family transcriptional regulator [Fimbriimonadaceae bacterium]